MVALGSPGGIRRAMPGGNSPHLLGGAGSRPPRIGRLYEKCHSQRVSSETAPKSTLKKAFRSNELVLSNLSILNKVAAAVEILPPALAAASGAIESATLSGALALTKGTYILAHAPAKLYKDYRQGNPESGFKHAMKGIVGAGYGAFGAATAVAAIAQYSGAAAVAAGASAAAGGFALYGASGAFSGYGLWTACLFRSILNQKLQEGDAKGLANALSWLRDQTLGLTEAELNKKWDWFAFRTSEAACRLVRQKLVPEFLQLVSQGDPAATAEAKWIIEEVKRENSKRMARHALYAITAMIGIAAGVAGLVFGGPLMPFLLALGVLLWIALKAGDADKMLANLLFGESKIPPPPPIELQTGGAPPYKSGSASKN